MSVLGENENNDLEPVPDNPHAVQEQLTSGESTVERVVQGELTAQQREILAFEKKFYKYAGVKERAIVTELNMTPIAYYQQVFALLQDPRAHALEPALMSRLGRLNQDRERRRVL